MDTTLLNEPAVRATVGIVIGLVMGSFTTMLSYRLPRRLSIVSPPSTCPSCKTKLTPLDLIPVLSWLIGKGRCRHCTAQIGARYLVIELITTLAITAAFIALGFTPALLAAIIGIVALITFTVIRLER